MKPYLVITTSLAVALTLSVGTGLAAHHRATAASQTQLAARSTRTPLVIDTIEMIDAHSGWALGHPVHASSPYDLVLRTTDGGQSWVDVTPSAVATAKYTLSRGSVTADRMLIVVSNPEQSILSYRTTDGGRTWSAGKPAKASFGDGILEAQFVDATHGFAEDSTAGNGTLSGELFRTDDGGMTWSRVAKTDWSSKTNAHNLPFGGDILFANSKLGWLAGGERAAQLADIGGPGFVWLYRTVDGGATWQHQSLPVPVGYHAAITFVSAPSYAGSTGLVEVTYQVPGKTDEVSVLYKTTNSGKTWSPVTKPSGFINSYGLLSPHVAYLAMSSGPMYWTSDGGKTWTRASGSRLPVSGNVGSGSSGNWNNFAVDNFVNGKTGWATAWSSGNSVLIKTINGGQSWSIVDAGLIKN